MALSLPKRDELKGQTVPGRVEDRLKRGRDQRNQGAAMRRLCVKFERGDTYWFINSQGFLDFQATTTNVRQRQGKPGHRIRNKYNFIQPIVQGKVSQVTQKTPSFRVMPTTTDPNDVHAAELASQISLFGYEKWRVRRAMVKAVTNALVMGEGFVMPYFDPNVGPFVDEVEKVQDPETGETVQIPKLDKRGNTLKVGTGEVKLAVFNGNEVSWEVGCDFYDSPWWAIERARPIPEIEALPGFVGGKIAADASTSEIPTDRADTDQLAMVTEYYERPTPQNPQGAKLVVVNKKIVVPPEPFPCVDSKGRVVDEPIIHRLSWRVDPNSDRDTGLVEQLLDLERTVQDCWNKLLEWKNRTLNPQMSAPRGSQVQRKTDEPGAVNYYNPIGGFKPEWEPTPSVPRELFEMLNMAIQHMRDLAADTGVQAEPDVAARTVQAVVEQHASRWQTFLADYADFAGRVMQSCLYLTSRFYVEDRLVQIMGDFGPELIPDFLGADLHSQVDVRVSPQSLVVLSPEAIEQRASTWALNQWISPAAAMRAINTGSTDGLMQGYEKQVSRAWEIISRIKQGPEALFNMPQRWDPKGGGTDPLTGAGIPGFVPGWMPREFDDVDVQLEVFVNFMTGSGFERMEHGMQEACYQIYYALKDHKARQEFEAAMAQQQTAMQLGMDNATRPADPKGMPSQPKPGGEQQVP